MRKVPESIARPAYVGKDGPEKYQGNDVYAPEQIARIRTAGKIAAQAIEEVGRKIRPGVTTDELDQIGQALA